MHVNPSTCPRSSPPAPSRQIDRSSTRLSPAHLYVCRSFDRFIDPPIRSFSVDLPAHPHPRVHLPIGNKRVTGLSTQHYNVSGGVECNTHIEYRVMSRRCSYLHKHDFVCSWSVGQLIRIRIRRFGRSTDRTVVTVARMVYRCSI